VGCRIYTDASIVQKGQKHLKRVIAEMGGKNALIVDESADLDRPLSVRLSPLLATPAEMFGLFADNRSGKRL
jgi:acyl-CoA reductase-like NAD-dependent aldehyde dehydrogenase